MRKIAILACLVVAAIAAAGWAATHSAWSGQILWDGTTGTQKGSVAATALTGLSVTPNPASLGHQVNFRLQGTLRSQDKASFGIYSVDGKILKSLAVSQLRTRGSVTWDQKDAKGKQLAAGVYLVRLKAGGKVFEAKILLTK